MKEREAVERVVARMYRHALRTTGRLPTGRERRTMESRARRAALETDNRRKRR